MTENLRAGGVAVYDGESSWEPGQLEAELERGEWLIVRSPALLRGLTAKRESGRPAEVWRDVLHALGGGYAGLPQLSDPELLKRLRDLQC